MPHGVHGLRYALTRGMICAMISLMIYKILNIIALICIILNMAAHAEPTNPCAWSATHTIYDKESRGCVTPEFYAPIEEDSEKYNQWIEEITQNKKGDK